MASENFTLEGHILDSLSLASVLDEILERGATYEILELDIGVKREDPSFARIRVTAASDEVLNKLIARLESHGANPDSVEDATLAPADRDGAFPPGFYSTTNLDTEVRVNDTWVPVTRPEMDCGIVVENGSARTIPMSEVRTGMQIVMRGLGI